MNLSLVVSTHIVEDQGFGLDTSRFHPSAVDQLGYVQACTFSQCLFLRLEHMHSLNGQLQLDASARRLPPRHGLGMWRQTRP